MNLIKCNMKKKLFIWMAAACTALMAAMVSCETPDVGENEDDGNNGDEPANVDVSMTGIWTIDPDAISGLSGLYIHQFRINEDGTGEVLYVDLNDTEFLYDYTVKLTVKEDDNSIEFTIDDVTPEKKVSVTQKNFFTCLAFFLNMDIDTAESFYNQEGYTMLNSRRGDDRIIETCLELGCPLEYANALLVGGGYSKLDNSRRTQMAVCEKKSVIHGDE